MNKSLIYLFTLSLLVGSSLAVLNPSKFTKLINNLKTQFSDDELAGFRDGESKTKYSVGHFSVLVDHFNYGFNSDATLQWNMRYLYNNTYWGGKGSLSKTISLFLIFTLIFN